MSVVDSSTQQVALPLLLTMILCLSDITSRTPRHKINPEIMCHHLLLITVWNQFQMKYRYWYKKYSLSMYECAAGQTEAPCSLECFYFRMAEPRFNNPYFWPPPPAMPGQVSDWLLSPLALTRTPLSCAMTFWQAPPIRYRFQGGARERLCLS